MRQRALSLALGWLMVAAIVWLSLTPSPPKLEFTFGDKLGHFAAYATLTFWFCELYVGRAARMAYAAAFIALGITLEFIQGTTGYRDFELADMAANTIGVLLGWAARSMAKRFAAAKDEAR